MFFFYKNSFVVLGTVLYKTSFAINHEELHNRDLLVPFTEREPLLIVHFCSVYVNEKHAHIFQLFPIYIYIRIE